MPSEYSPEEGENTGFPGTVEAVQEGSHGVNGIRPLEGSVHGKADNTGLFRYNNDRRVRVFTDADSGAVAGAESADHTAGFRQRQDACRGHDPVFPDHNGSVMQGRVRFKYVFKQRGGNLSVQRRTGFNNILESCFPFKNNQRADPATAQVDNCLDNLIDDDFCVFIFIAMVPSLLLTSSNPIFLYKL